MHLDKLYKELRIKDIEITYRGQPWTDNCREWVYFDCYFDYEKLHARLEMSDCVIHHINDDPHSGLEEGFYCETCKDAIIGIHRNNIVQGKPTIE